jgi:hypothetical protein
MDKTRDELVGAKSEFYSTKSTEGRSWTRENVKMILPFSNVMVCIKESAFNSTSQMDRHR